VSEPADAPATSEPPYELVRCLGVGGMAETWEARNVRKNGLYQHFCLKFILPAFRSAPEFTRLFRREAEIGTTLRHKNIVSLIEVDAELGYLKFELINGVNLRELLRAQSEHRLAFEVVHLVAAELAQALEYVHGQGVLHQDLTPANVLVSTSGEVKLVDFGIATRKRDGEPATNVRGTAVYMSPEQAQQQAQDGRSDLFSLGLVLYELLTGKRPADSACSQRALEQLAYREYPPVGTVVDGIPEQLRDVVDKLLEPNPARRFEHAGACLDKLCDPPPRPTLSRELGRMVSEAKVLVERKRSMTPVTSFALPLLEAERARKPSRLTGEPTSAAVALQRQEAPTKPSAMAPGSRIEPTNAHEQDVVEPPSPAVVHSEKQRARMYTATTEIMLRAVHAPRRRALGVLGLASIVTALLVAATTLTRGERPRSVNKVLEAASTVTPVMTSTSAGVDTTRRPSVDSAPEAPPPLPELQAAVQPPLRHQSRKPLKPAQHDAAVLRVSAFPASRVWVDGEYIAETPLDKPVAPGDHLVAFGDDHPTKTIPVTVRARETKEVYFDRSTKN
jgi:serine/threonine protein kinase